MTAILFEYEGLLSECLLSGNLMSGNLLSEGLFSGGPVFRATDFGFENPLIMLESLGSYSLGVYSLKLFTQSTQTCALSINTRIFLFLP